MHGVETAMTKKFSVSDYKTIMLFCAVVATVCGSRVRVFTAIHVPLFRHFPAQFNSKMNTQSRQVHYKQVGLA